MWFAHVLHGTFQNEHKNAKWNVNTALRSFYKLFHDSQARQADYQKTNDSSVFPTKFWTNRCVEKCKTEMLHRDLWICNEMFRNMLKTHNYPITSL